jgi:hypothetical protein
MRPDQRVHRLERDCAGPHLVGQGGKAELDALAGVALGLPVERLMLAGSPSGSTRWRLDGSLSNRIVASRFGPAQPRGVGWNGAGG